MGATHNKWEYCILRFGSLSIDGNLNIRLNTFGNDGWELVSVTHSDRLQGGDLFFKRQVFPSKKKIKK